MMKTMIGTSFLTASLLVSGATAAVAGTEPTLGPYGYGVVKLGMTAKQAKATGVAVETSPSDKVQCSSWELKKFPDRYSSVGVWMSPRVGVAAIFAVKGMKTPQGIKIGSTFEQLKAAYPRIREDYHGYEVIRVPGNKKAYYSFEVRKGKVIGYGIALYTQDCFN